MRRAGSLDRLLALGRYGFPFGFGTPKSEIVRLRRYTLRERLRTKPAYQRLLVTIFCSLVYPFLAGLEVWKNLKILKLNRQHAGAGPAWRMLELALRGNVPPVEYVSYRFEDPARRALWREYLYWTDSEAVKLLNRLRSANPEDVQDKVRFAEICTTHGLPHAEVLGEFGAGAAGILTEERLTGDVDLWVKPVNLQGGVGAESWQRRDGGYVNADGRVFSREQFLRHLNDGRGRRMVQPRLRNHPEIAAVSNEWLATLRIVVALQRDGRIVWLGNELGLPKGKSMVSQGGMICAVSWEAGVIFHVADPTSLGKTAAEDICHPDTGNRLMGQTIPFWRESLELVERAHRGPFSRFATLGWDLALTPDGPLLLEANSGWGRIHTQIVFGPLGRTALTEMIAEELPR